MNSTLVLLLAGGVGSRLNILGAARAKPAVPFGGIYRIIDFTLSNAMNSGLNTVGVLTQYKPLSLMQHIGSGEPWDLIGRTRGAKILPPRTGQKDSDWYKGTADAVRQNIDFIENHDPEHILILSGDHIYKMDYAALLDFHKDQSADFTIGVMTVPWEETRHFGVAITDEQNRIIDWEEKPAQARNNLASMGIYVFNAEYLLSKLRAVKEHDFGKNLIPDAIQNDDVFAYPFEGYWRDVGTLKAYWEANMDLLNSSSGIDIASWGLRTNVEEEGRLGDRTPSFVMSKTDVSNSIISPGCKISGQVQNSILSPGVVVEEGAAIRDSVIMHDCVIGRGAEIESCIVDKRVRIGDQAHLGLGSAETPNQENPDHLDSGLVVVGKGAHIPTGTKIGKNSILHPALRQGDFPAKDIPAGATLKPTQIG